MVTGATGWKRFDVLPDLSLYSGKCSNDWGSLQCPNLSDISVISHHPCRELSQHLLAAQDGKDVVAEVAGDLGLDVIEADEFVA